MESVEVASGALDQLAPFVKLAVEAEVRSRGRANAARDRVTSLRQQLAEAEKDMATAVRESESDQTFLRDVWETFRSESQARR